MPNIKVGFLSLGCPKNTCDTEVMLGLLNEKGYELVAEDIYADVMIINTCAFIQSAKEEAINTILEMAEYKEGRCKKLLVFYKLQYVRNIVANGTRRHTLGLGAVQAFGCYFLQKFNHCVP